MIIIFCPNCGNQINDNEKFCSKCGNQIKQDSQDNNEQMKQSEKTISNNISQNVDTEKNYTKYKYIGIYGKPKAHSLVCGRVVAPLPRVTTLVLGVRVT